MRNFVSFSGMDEHLLKLLESSVAHWILIKKVLAGLFLGSRFISAELTNLFHRSRLACFTRADWLVSPEQTYFYEAGLFLWSRRRVIFMEQISFYTIVCILLWKNKSHCADQTQLFLLRRTCFTFCIYIQVFAMTNKFRLRQAGNCEDDIPT